VLQLLAAGRRNAEIAARLGILLKTVEYHISCVLDKVGARSRAEAIRTARRQGLIL
jgi:DNA-binding NarL/FixJ family response regulator